MARESSDSESESEEEVRYPPVNEYEKQRLSRMAENKARLEALGISKAAKALVTRGKPNSIDDDDDYRPEDDIGDDDEGNSSTKIKKRLSASKRTLVLNSKNKNLNGDDDDDDDLNKAIALSLQEGSSCKKKKKPELMISKMHMSEDEMVIYFYLFDEAGKGFITLRDVVKMATLHDFTWTDEELQDMICCFDMDKDGKLCLDDFRKIVTRCRMLKQS